MIIVSAVAAVAKFVGDGYTAMPASLQSPGKRVQLTADAALGRDLGLFHPFRQGLTAYLDCTGIDGGYTFFAPSVPNSYKVVFEIHYPDGRIDYELPRIAQAGASFRLSTMLHHVGRTNDNGLREVMLEMMTYQVAQTHPTAAWIRTVFGCIDEPTLSEAAKGQTESYRALCAYDFNLGPPTVNNNEP